MDRIDQSAGQANLERAAYELLEKIDVFGVSKASMFATLMELIQTGSDRRGFAWERGILRLTKKLSARERLENTLISEKDARKLALLRMMDDVMQKYSLSWEAISDKIKSSIVN